MISSDVCKTDCFRQVCFVEDREPVMQGLDIDPARLKCAEIKVQVPRKVSQRWSKGYLNNHFQAGTISMVRPSLMMVSS